MTPPARPSETPPRTLVCSSCPLREICLPLGCSPAQIARVDRRLVALRRAVEPGERLLGRGDAFDAVFAIRSGFFKTRLQSAGAAEQVTGFHMGGELIGLDGIAGGRHETDAVALETSLVCRIPFARLERLTRELVPLRQQLHRILSREITRKQQAQLLLGGRPADERVAAFLFDLSRRLAARGYSATSMVLRMSRREIGSYLGLELETVSRALSRLRAEGVLTVRRREVRITEPLRLQHIANAPAG